MEKLEKDYKEKLENLLIKAKKKYHSTESQNIRITLEDIFGSEIKDNIKYDHDNSNYGKLLNIVTNFYNDIKKGPYTGTLITLQCEYDKAEMLCWIDSIYQGYLENKKHKQCKNI